MKLWVLASLSLPAVVLAGPPGSRSLSERAAAADRVALVSVLDTSVQVPDGDPAKMVTVTRLSVEQDLKGSGLKTVELIQLGGSYGDWTRRVAGDASFSVGERSVVFLRCPGGAARCSLIGLAAGKLALIPGSSPTEVRVMSRGTEERAPLASVIAQVQSAAAPAPATTKSPEAGNTGARPKVSR